MKNDTLAKRLKYARLLAGYTMTGLERAADVSGSVVSKIENGTRLKTSTETIEALCAPLGCRAEWMAWGTGERE